MCIYQSGTPMDFFCAMSFQEGKPQDDILFPFVSPFLTLSFPILCQLYSCA